MEIFNRPPTISEDTLQYYLYPPSGSSDKASVTASAACIDSFLDALAAGMIWHRDAFELKFTSDPDVSDGYLLEGRMRVGDCVDDEWCVVWLLKEISAKWDLAISVYDSDGEFLLIEAAEALPSWVKPSNAENRVWIYRSRIHLVPLSHVSPPSRPRRRRRLLSSRDSDDDVNHIGGDGSDDWIAVGDALKIVRDPSVNTLSPPEVESLIWKRTSRYPAAIRSHAHAANAHLPLDVARALSVNPALIQKSVETFYTRDALQLRAAHRMSRFPPEPSVLRTVKMTRTAYAQLVGQKFHPPKIFGKPVAKEGTDEWRWRDIGMKIACGFEMLYQECKARTDISISTTEVMRSSSDARKEALRRNSEYMKYLQILTSAGYFQGELKGSQRWNELEDKAVVTFVNVRKKDNASRPSFSAMLTTAISQSKDNSIKDTQEQEDSHDWLNVNAQDFDDMLEKTMGTSRSNRSGPPDTVDMDIDSHNLEGDTEEDHAANEQASRLQGLAQKVESFVEGDGDMGGAKFDDEASSSDEFSDEKMSNSSDDNELEEVDLAERKAAMDKLVPALGPSEYGQMPALFHANSQRVAPTMETGVDTELNGPKKNSKASIEPEKLMKPIRRPILPPDKYDGMDSDDETDEEDGAEADESEEDQPQVVGEVDVDMGEEEEEFLEFSRQALGISDEQWGEIVRNRKGRGAFVPSSVMDMPAVKTSRPPQEVRAERQNPAQGRPPAPAPRPNANPNLDSFEAVMQAMDAELARTRQPKAKTASAHSPAPSTKGKANAASSGDEADIESAMDAELKCLLETGDDEGSDEETPADYNLIKNFLESFKSQGGLSGPVSNLAGRLQPNWQLPRDEAS